MEEQISIYRVFIASPADLAEERKLLRDVVTEINAIFARETQWRIELLGWEDTMPGGGRPQDLINVDVDKANLLLLLEASLPVAGVCTHIRRSSPLLPACKRPHNSQKMN